jgi:hypothetical protein
MSKRGSINLHLIKSFYANASKKDNMSSEIDNEVLTELKLAARPLVELGLYDSAREFVRDITKEFIKKKIEFYKKQTTAFKKKYGSFKALSKKLENGASIAEEDEWMGWEAAENMLKVWKKAARETGLST